MSANPPTSTSVGSSPAHFDWKRFWVPQTEIFDLSDAGFLRDPESFPFDGDSLKTLSELDGYPFLALLGEPGIGKSDILTLEHERLSALEPGQNIVSVHVDLNSSSSEDRLCRQIFESAKVSSWKEGDSRLYLFLDSLDEAMIEIKRLAHRLVAEFRSLPTDRLSVRIACRTAVWPASILGDPLEEIWGESNFGIFKLAPLRRRDVLSALSTYGIDPEEFFSGLITAQAVPFAIKPLTLEMLLRIYQRERRLPRSTTNLYRQGCLDLCEEQNPSRRETGYLGTLTPLQRLRLAGRIAAATVLGDRFAIWTGLERNTPPEDVSLSALAGSPEEGDFPPFTVTEDNVREVLDTGLFSARDINRLGWAHQSYGEFLAALYLLEKGVSPHTALKAITHPDGGLIPQLAIMGAWLASINPEMRRFLIETDPWTLLRGDLSSWEGVDKAALVDSMLSKVEEGRLHEIFFGFSEMYEKLNHPNIGSQLRGFITNHSLKISTRRDALSIAERCELRELQPEILQIALDITEDPTVRAAAIAALRRCGDASAPPQILTLLQGAIGPDPHDEIRGYALDLLWPNFIDANQLFSLITAPNERFVGSYALFLYKLPQTLRMQDLVPAITWATAYITASNPMGGFREKTLADAIMFKVWDVFEDPALSGLFMDHVAARLHNYGEIYRGTDSKAIKAFEEKISRDSARRHIFLLFSFQRHLDRYNAFLYLRAGFLENEDFYWLLEISPGGLSPITGLNEETLSTFISLMFSYENRSQFEALLPVSERWPLLRQVFSSLFDGVPLDSPEARQSREWNRQNQELQSRVPPPQTQDLSAEILRLLEGAEAGDWQAWWKLNLALMITPENQIISDERNYFITIMPGWVVADEGIKQRIISTAERYLTDAETSVDVWLGQQPMSLQRNDLAAMRAFLLLLQVDPDAYNRIPVLAWEKWAPVIVGLPRFGDTDKSPEVQTLLKDALQKAPLSFISTVRKILQIEKERNRSRPEGSEPNAHPFMILHDLEGCWDGEGFKHALFEEMTAADIQPNEYIAILDALLKVVYEPALEHGLGRINNLEENTSEIAEIFLRWIPTRVWPILWPKMLEDDQLVKDVLVKSTNMSFADTPFYAYFLDEEIADLYLLIERLFPPENDPEGMSGFIGPLDMIPNLRDNTVRILAARGTEEAVRALRRLAAERPNRPLLPFELSRGEHNMRQKTWTPLTPREILALTDRLSSRLITSAADLLEILEETLSRYETELHGTQNPVRDLWDRQNRGEWFQPIEEQGISDVIARYLKEKLEGRGIFANREVEVKRRPGSPVGTRTDILITAFRRHDDGRTFDPIKAVIEIKGCWNRQDLFSGLENQLFRDYMVPVGAPIGFYLVAWFDQAQWDEQDSRRSQVPRDSINSVKEQLGQQATQIPEGFQVKPYVLKIRAPGL